MSNPSPKNLSESVFQRLKNIAKNDGDDFNLILSRYAMERFIYRLRKRAEIKCSKYRSRLLESCNEIITIRIYQKALPQN